MRQSEMAACRAFSARPSGCFSVRKSPAILLLVGCVAGAGLLVLAGCQSTSVRAVAIQESRYKDVDRTSEALRSAIEAEGLHCPGIRNLNKSMAKHGVHLSRQVRVVEFCKADYAHDMLEVNPEVAVLMPCTFAVYEGDDGKVYISRLNQRLMAQMFGPTVAKVMGERVVRDEAGIFEAYGRNGE